MKVEVPTPPNDQALKEVRPKGQSRVILWVFLAAILAFVLGWQAGRANLELSFAGVKTQVLFKNKLPPSQVTVDLAPFWQAWDVVFNEYIDRANIVPQDLVYGAISGMVRSLGDPYSSFLKPDENQAVKEDLKGIYQGVGIRLGFRDTKVVVIAPLKGTPAYTAGIKPGDEILSIDNKTTEGMSLPEAVKLIRGQEGTKVVLKLKRQDQEPFDLEVRRAAIEVKSVEVEYLDSPKGKIALLRLSRFGDQTASEWDKAVEEIQKTGVFGLILDLRSNPGGFLNGATYVASEFLEGKIVGTKDASSRTEFLEASRKGKFLNLPVTVLIDKGTASASEILAGAIADHKRGKLVGEQSFGKGTVQNPVDFEDKSGILITVSKWVLPSGREINGEGLKPDIVVEAAKDLVESKDDPQVKKALELF